MMEQSSIHVRAPAGASPCTCICTCMCRGPRWALDKKVRTCSRVQAHVARMCTCSCTLACMCKCTCVHTCVCTRDMHALSCLVPPGSMIKILKAQIGICQAEGLKDPDLGFEDFDHAWARPRNCVPTGQRKRSPVGTQFLGFAHRPSASLMAWAWG